MERFKKAVHKVRQLQRMKKSRKLDIIGVRKCVELKLNVEISKLAVILTLA